MSILTSAYTLLFFAPMLLLSRFPSPLSSRNASDRVSALYYRESTGLVIFFPDTKDSSDSALHEHTSIASDSDTLARGVDDPQRPSVLPSSAVASPCPVRMNTVQISAHRMERPSPASSLRVLSDDVRGLVKDLDGTF